MEPDCYSKAVSSILVANNGLAAVKFIRSIRAWSLATTGNDHAISIVAMASPEDIHGGTEHVLQADKVVEVPGGASSLNYGNPELIVQLAEQCGVDAVWPGWGHASENPQLPMTLRRKSAGTVFLGPPASAMSALGDKIGSTIIAQTVGVPTVPWTGLGLKAPSDGAAGGNLVDQDTSQQLYLQCCIKNARQATDSCNQVGYPILLKAAWGGGGRGIRKVTEASEVASAFAAVEAEVPGSPIFATKMMSNCRHLEVQLVADKYHNVASLFTRDCSVQRRHQKLIEEGPAYQGI
ncbi:hypothetical protein WJX84_000710 [Apatococcus fuscideae]|uniref:Biotin carboxylation domain-containing protein n=1 Tax=Apatococcus fuscideae TaxID=2026836 RepID=A0AAW1SUJ4_9CHLO